MLSNYALKLMEKSLYGDRLREDLDIARGTKSITDLPSFAPAAQGVRDQGALALQDVAKSIMEGGTSGPAAGLAMEKAGEGVNDAVLGLPGKMLASREADPWKAYDNTLKRRQQNMQYALSQQAQEAAEPSGADTVMKFLPIAGSVGSGILSSLVKAVPAAAGAASSCCFIFLEGNNGMLEEPVRIFRDKYFSPDSWVSKGYKRMASWLVPMMKKSKTMKKTVKLLMLDPLARIARWHEGTDKLGWLFIPVGVFWCFIWGESARLREVV